MMLCRQELHRTTLKYSYKDKKLKTEPESVSDSNQLTRNKENEGTS